MSVKRKKTNAIDGQNGPRKVIPDDMPKRTSDQLIQKTPLALSRNLTHFPDGDLISGLSV